jgi:hypothetical protein
MAVEYFSQKLFYIKHICITKSIFNMQQNVYQYATKCEVTGQSDIFKLHS